MAADSPDYVMKSSFDADPSLRVLLIGLPGDQLSEAAAEACSKKAGLLEILLSMPKSAAGKGPATLAALPARPWFGDMTELMTILAEKEISLILTAGCRYLLPQAIVKRVREGAFNVHPSLLPKYRGFAPLFWQYHEGDLNAGVTVHRIDAGIDTGPIVGHEGFQLPRGASLLEVVPLYSAATGRLATALLEQVVRGNVEERAQEPISSLLLARKPRPEDYCIDWRDWPIERCWHFLRMNGAVANRALPPVGEALILKQQRQPSPQTAPVLAAVRWEVGGLVLGEACGKPGELIEKGDGFAVVHSAGSIRLRLVEAR